MILPNVKGYVISKGFRDIYRWGAPFLFAVLLSLTAMMIILGIQDKDDCSQEFGAAAVFFCIFLWGIFSVHSGSPFMEMTFYCEEDLITNWRGQEKQYLNLDSSIFLAELAVDFTMKVAFTERFFILSDKPFWPNGYLENGGLQVIKKAWKNGLIVLPGTDEVRDWLCWRFKLSVIPQYPKVAYLQKNSFQTFC